MAGLIHPSSLERWQEWQSTRNRARQVKHAVTSAVRSRRGTQQLPGLVLHSREGEGDTRLLIALDSASPTSRASLLTSLPYLRIGVDVLSPAGLDLPELDGDEWTHQRIEPATTEDEQRRRLAVVLDRRGIGAVLTLGQHLAAGRSAHEWALATDTASAVVQHGALTPYAPPLPPRTTLLAWSDADAEFYRSGRDDVEVRTVGSQLLWQAGKESEGEVDVTGQKPVFLGQMHGAELPRRITAGIAMSFCRAEGALYRPHPSEVDVLSRAAHRLMTRRGVEFQDTSIPLHEVRAPVVGIFSTGVLEAAARGIPSWVAGEKVPAWVREFWDRYDMRRWGGEPTPALATGADEPSRLIAQILEGAG
ncbi:MULTISPECIES: hypothetical protein [Brachybacterium]|uniref:hypothetical protein n=1 Tax=Brachybacterium TaxID=43668 RepID=UPI0021A33FF2|nr:MULTISPECIES: hypothetical protein [Brachybacterium]MCT1908966.1 hypothetical protein [Brachybacterium paraconglomeratum]